MSRNPFAGHPFLLGFEEVGRHLDQASKNASDGYPPYNIEQTGESAYRIILAVAGFSDDDLTITVEDRKLLVRGKQANAPAERVFLHRGIATRQFLRQFVLADGVEVSGALLENGLLNIDLHKVNEEPVVKKVHITKG